MKKNLLLGLGVFTVILSVITLFSASTFSLLNNNVLLITIIGLGISGTILSLSSLKTHES
ncbi:MULTISPECIES: hypothetical protein [Bacillaceae]|uniref:Uncharacterized protein n=1 Tax=Alkalicoccobacillus plakortidis TaxID=444060 RepID=A0A9D5HXP7_9BACI|nr:MULTISPECIES: hypothetical protein [Bacillaceae]KQL56989.1 hypothetical protein AN965_11045 [Alkalicoccobacillus plakortidis]